MKDSPLDNRHQCIEETEPSPAEPLRVEASQAAQLGIEASEAEPSQAGSSQSKTSPVHLLHAGASQADPSQAKPLQAEPLQAGAPHEGEGLFYTIETNLDWLCFVCIISKALIGP